MILPKALHKLLAMHGQSITIKKQRMFLKPNEMKVTTRVITHTPYEVSNTTRKSRSVYKNYHLNRSIRTEIKHLFPNT